MKSKTNILRTYYSKELKLEKDSKKSGASGETYESKWPHFNSLAFLRDTIKPRNTTSTLVSIILEKYIISRSNVMCGYNQLNTFR